MISDNAKDQYYDQGRTVTQKNIPEIKRKEYIKGNKINKFSYILRGTN